MLLCEVSRRHCPYGTGNFPLPLGLEVPSPDTQANGIQSQRTTDDPFHKTSSAMLHLSFAAVVRALACSQKTVVKEASRTRKANTHQGMSSPRRLPCSLTCSGEQVYIFSTASVSYKHCLGCFSHIHFFVSSSMPTEAAFAASLESLTRASRSSR